MLSARGAPGRPRVGKGRAEREEEIANAPLLPIGRDKSSPRPGAQINRRSVAKGPRWELSVPLRSRAVRLQLRSPRSGFTLPATPLPCHCHPRLLSPWTVRVMPGQPPGGSVGPLRPAWGGLRGHEVPGDLPGHLSPSTRPGGCCSRGWHGVTVPPHRAAGRCPVRSGRDAGRAAEPGSAPSGLPLPTAAPARSPRHRCTATVHLLSALTRNLHWGKKPKKPDPKCIPQPREAEQAQGGKSGAQESGAPIPSSCCRTWGAFCNT